jgi:hypothetical protein
MVGQPGFFEAEDRLSWLSASGDPLERLRAVVGFEAFRGELEAALPPGGSQPRRPPALGRGADVPRACAASALHAVRRSS